jgi:septum formation topological specificity factor MinE
LYALFIVTPVKAKRLKRNRLLLIYNRSDCKHNYRKKLRRELIDFVIIYRKPAVGLGFDFRICV